MAFLQQFIDPGLRVSKSDTPEGMAKKEIERLQELHAIAIASMNIPRRLGGDATDEELTNDKKCGRRVAHVASQCLTAWGSEPKPISKNINRAAAQVRWSRWMAEHLLYLDQRMRYIATWQYKTGKDEKWAKSALVRLSNEQRWLEYSLRDAPN